MSGRTFEMKFKFRKLLINISIIFASMLLTYLALEVIIRIAKEKLFDIENQVVRKSNFLTGTHPIQFDSYLGWIPKPGASAGSELWLGKKVSILNNGCRSNGHEDRIRKAPFILAMGDSFTFGEEVSDNETWPAHFEQLSNVSVLNGGVFGYGLDQILLRTKMLVDKFSPDILIVCFIYDDILRCEFSTRGYAAKPYFDLENGELVLYNRHVTPLRNKKIEYSWFQKVFGYSYLMHSIMIRLNGYFWLSQHGSNKQVHIRGFLIGRALLEELSSFSRSRNLKTLVVLHDEGAYQEDFERLLSGLDLRGLEILNLIPLYKEVYSRDKSAINRFKNKLHPSSLGNLFVAQAIYNKLKEPHFL